MTETPKTTPKISVKIWKPLIQMLDQKLEATCLRRDAFLTKLLEVELDHLDEEVSIPNTQASYDFVFSRLDAFVDRKLVSLALPSELTSKLNDICQRKRIVRDAFFNRLYFLLAMKPAVIDSWLFPGGNWRREVWNRFKDDDRNFQEVFYPLQPQLDPFWAIREAMKIEDEKIGNIEDYVEPESGKSIRITRDSDNPIPLHNIYTIVFEKTLKENNFLGFSCYLPERYIPGTNAEKEHQSKLDDLNDVLENLE